MTASGSKSLPSIGFLTVREFDELGLIGGFLILNTVGRPLEFHCTAPVRPNRSQEILYGPTLAPFLYGEQIGQTLVAKCRTKPLFICTDKAPVLSLREHIDAPVLLLDDLPDAEPSDPAGAVSRKLRVDDPHPTTLRSKTPALRIFQLDRRTAAVAQRYSDDQEVILQRWRPYADELDLWEPFARLADAIDEAQRGASQGPGTRDQRSGK